MAEYFQHILNREKELLLGWRNQLTCMHWFDKVNGYGNVIIWDLIVTALLGLCLV